jgi:endonuclease/exonuclease/phosphatase (EEP) superfamily protein YafD
MNRSGGINEAEVLAQKSGLTNFYFVKNRDRDGGEHGIAVLSRFPLGPLTAHETRGTDAPNHILQTVADVYGTPINLFANHYLAGDDENAKTGRLEASTRAVELLDQVTGSVIFGGDLNAEPERLEIQLLTSKLSDAWYAAPQDRHFCGGGLKRIDYIFFRGPYVVRQFEAPCLPLHESFLPKYEKPNCSLADADLSDHSFVLVKFEIVSN